MSTDQEFSKLANVGFFAAIVHEFTFIKSLLDLKDRVGEIMMPLSESRKDTSLVDFFFKSLFMIP